MQEEIKMEKLTTYSTDFGKEKYRVKAVAITCGRDVAVTVGGGTGYHIGKDINRLKYNFNLIVDAIKALMKRHYQL